MEQAKNQICRLPYQIMLWIAIGRGQLCSGHWGPEKGTYYFAKAALKFHITLAVMMDVSFAVLAFQAIFVVDCKERKGISGIMG